MAAVYPGAKYGSLGTILTNTSETKVLDCIEPFRVLVTSLTATKDSGAAGTLRLVLHKSGGSDFAIFHNKVIPASSSLYEEFTPLVLQAGDELRATGDAAGIHVIVSFYVEARNNT
jgi:hypothetical protein